MYENHIRFMACHMLDSLNPFDHSFTLDVLVLNTG